MTQLMLFDSVPASVQTAAPQNVVAPQVSPKTPAGRQSATPAETLPSPPNSPEPAGFSKLSGSVKSPDRQRRSDDGIQQMGDLARLVILRYQLLAKRRAEMAARAGKTAAGAR